MHPVHERKLHFGFLVIPVIMFFIGLYAYRIPEQQTRQGEWVAHTQEVLAELAFLSLHLTDAETGQRGYLLTGQAVFLSSYSLALQQIDSDMARFQQLTEDNSRQQSQVPLLRVQIAVKLAELKQTIQLHNSLRPEAALKVVFAGSGRRQMEVIQKQIEQMQAEQTTLLQQGVAQWKVASAQTRLTFMGAGVLLYSLLGLVYIVMRKKAEVRKRLMKVEQQATIIQRQATDVQRQAANIQQAEAERLAKVVAIQRDVACAGQDLQATMQTIVERTQAITYAEGCAVEMVEDDNLVYRYASGTAMLHLGLRLKTANSLSGLCIRENVILKCDDTETDARVNRAACRKVGLRSMMVVPLHTGGRTVGVLKVLSSRAAAFTEPDVATLELLGGTMSAALSTAFAMDALQATEERLEEAQQVAHVGSWSLDLVTQQTHWSKEIFWLFDMAPEWGEPDFATALTLYAPESAARLEACVQATLRDGGGFAVDLQQGVVAGGAAPRWYHLVGKPILDVQGKAIRLVGTLLDITVRKRAEEMLCQHEAHLQGIVTTAVDGIITIDERGTIQSFNPAAERIFGYSAAEVIGKNVNVLMPEPYTSEHDGYLAHHLQTGERKIIGSGREVRGKRKDGGVFPLDLAVSSVQQGEDKIFVGIVRDITERMQTEMALLKSQEQLVFAQHIAQMGSWEYDIATSSISWSSEMFILLELDMEQGVPDYTANFALYHPEDASLLYTCVQQAVAEGKAYDVDVRQAAKEGQTTRWYRAAGRGVRDSTGQVVQLVGTLLDITESKHHAWEMDMKNAELEAANGLLQVQATTDGLTGLKNRRAFQERLTEEYQRALRYKTPLSIIMLDVDHFKPFNDTFGHPAGDGVLRSVASLLHTMARTSDLVARYGGEEFIVLLPETEAVGAARIAERIREAIAGATWEERAITVSVGAVTLDRTTESEAQLVDTADKALYQSKLLGRNRVTHTGGVPFLLEDNTVEDNTAVCRVAI